MYAPTGSITEEADAPEGLLAIDDATGELLWRYEVPGEPDQGWTFAPAFSDGLVFVSLAEAGVVALDAATGDVEWSTGVRANGPPTVADGHVFVPGEDTGEDDDADHNRSFLAALDARSGEETWRKTGAGERYGQEIAAANGRIYARERVDSLVCRDGETGAERWRYTDPPYVSSGRPVVTSDVLYVGINRDGDRDSGVVALDPETGERLGFASSGERDGFRARLAAGEDELFFAEDGVDVYALGPCTIEARGRCLY